MTFDNKCYRLYDLINIIGGGTPKTSVKEYWNGDIPWLSVKDFGNDDRYVYVTEKNISIEGLKKSSTKMLKKNDIIISARGTVGELAMLPFPMAFNQSCYGVRPNNKLLDNTYLYYLMKNSVALLKSNAHGSVFDTITRDTFKEIEISLPPLTRQKEIAHSLSILDDKIEINKKINHHLEEMAQSIFKSWFVDLTPFNKKIPSDWIGGVLGDFVTIKRGGSPRPIQEFLSEKGYRWLKISDVSSLDTPYVYNIREHIKVEGLKKTVLLRKKSLVLSNSATPGIPKILAVDSCIHDGWLYFPESKLSQEFLYLFFNYIRPNLVSLGNGSVFTNLKTDIIKNYNFFLPTNEVLMKFNQMIIPIFREIQANTEENLKLIKLRDSLLPKLMSGKIIPND